MIHLYNTLSGKKEVFKIPKNRALKLFVCGPTVYNLAHIGHARTYVAFDAFVRYLRLRGIKVFYLQNITDVDDKIIARAREQKKNPLALSKQFTREYLKDMKGLGIRSIDKYAPASAFIPQIVKQVKALIRKGHAYKIEGEGYYFDLKTFPDYGKLAKRTTEQAEDAVSRIDESIHKRNKGDFCLWKLTKTWNDAEMRLLADVERRGKKFAVINGEPLWKTDLGWGRPGWHIEDTSITETYFGPQYDIHGGGVDIKFPHHESEIAQQESSSGKKPFVKIWMHTGHLLVGGKKMSKSAHNFITIREFLENHSPQVLRYMTLMHHYRSPMDYTEMIAEQAQNALNKIRSFLQEPKNIATYDVPILGYRKSQISNTGEVKRFQKKFLAALNDDFNTPRALAVLWDVVREKNLSITLKRRLLREFGTVFGLGLQAVKPVKIPSQITALARKREGMRRRKQFIQADALRKQVEGLGYTIDDTPTGPKVHRQQ